VKIIATILSVLMLTASTQAGTLGFENIAAYPTSIENVILGDRDAAPSSGILDSIRVYLAVTTAAHDVHCAVYKVSDESLVDSSEIKSVGVGTAWVVFDLKLDGAIYADTVYAVVAQAKSVDGDCKMYLNLTGNYLFAYEAHTFGSWDDPWTGMGGGATRDVSIYAYYTLSPPSIVNYRCGPDGVAVRCGPDGGSVRHGP